MVTTTSLDRTAAPGSLPVTVAEAKQKLRIAATATTHDDELTRQIEAATELFEQDTDRAVITQDYAQYRDCFSDFMSLPVKPIQSIIQIDYCDINDVVQQVTGTIYGFDSARRVVYRKHDQTWPTITDQHNAVVIKFRAGYGTATSVPREIKEAILCKVAELFYGDAPEAMRYGNAYRAIVETNIRTSIP